MFGQFFGTYLVDSNKISQTQFEDIMHQHQSNSLKLGFIAITEKLLTTKQANEINELQKKIDQRFGDIALEKGYLLNEEITYLLNIQENPYLTFIQALIDHTYLTISEIENYLHEYQTDFHFSTSDIDALKSGDINRIIPIFVEVKNPLTNDCIHLMLRNILRLINKDFILQKMTIVKEYDCSHLAFQKMEGDHQVFIGFAGADEQALLNIANPFANEFFDTLDEDAFDSICEFINCSNGLFASKLSLADIHIDMTPPVFGNNQTLYTTGDIYVIPVLLQRRRADLLVCFDHDVNVRKMNRITDSLVIN